MARRISVEIVGDSRSLERAFRRSSAAGQRFDRTFTRSLTGSALAFGGVTSAALLAGSALRSSIQEFAEAAKVSAQTEAVLKSTGGVAHVTGQDVKSLADEVLRYSGIDDEAVQSAENLLLTFRHVRNEVGEGNDVFNRATKAAVDLSVAGFGSLDTTAKQLGKALEDPVKGMTALRRAGVTFSAAQQATIKSMVETGQTLEAQKLILREVETQVGGSAEAFGKTLPGQVAKAQEQLKNLGAEIITVLVPAVTGSIDAVNDLVAAFERLDRIGATLTGGAGPFSRIKAKLDETLGRAPDWFKAFGPLGPVAFLFNPPTPVVLNFAKAWESVGDAITGAARNLSPFRRAFADIAKAFRVAGKKFGPKDAASPSPFALPGPLRVAQAQAGVTAAIADDVAVAKRIKAFIESRIAAGTLKGERLIDALGVLASAEGVITSAVEDEASKRKAASEKEADARKKSADALKRSAERFAQRTDEFRQQIGELFTGPVFNPSEADRRARLGFAAATPTAAQILSDLRGQNNAFASFQGILARLARAGAPGALISELRGRGPEVAAFAQAILGDTGLRGKIFSEFQRREKLARKAAKEPLRVFVTVNLDGRTVAANVTAHQQRDGNRQGRQRRGPQAGRLLVQ